MVEIRVIANKEDNFTESIEKASEYLNTLTSIKFLTDGYYGDEEMIKLILSDTFNKTRNQFDLDRINKNIKYHLGGYSVVVVEDDLFAEGLNWCFGGMCPDSNSIILSKKRIVYPQIIVDLILHELGHFFGACETNGRQNTEEKLGMHCTNTPCIMCQAMTVKEMVVLSMERVHTGFKFCEECEQEIKK